MEKARLDRILWQMLRGKTSSEVFPIPWKTWTDCVRKFPDNIKAEKYGVPDPKGNGEMIYSDCPAKCWWKFLLSFYENDMSRKLDPGTSQYIFITFLENLEGKTHLPAIQSKFFVDIK